MNQSRPITRRTLLRHGLAAAAAFSGLARPRPRRADAAPLGDAERIRIGVIGTGVRGKHLIGNLPEGTRVAAICDCATTRMAGTLEPKEEFAEVLAAFRDKDARRCATYQDYRRMVDRERLDAVIIATPDHHHAQAALLALDAGLDVYLEKPLAVTVGEGRLLVDKVNATGRVLQVGSQQRSMELNRFACEFVRRGGLGKISKVELPNYPGPISQPRLPRQPAPEGLDWDLFLGPAPWREHHRKLWVKDEFRVDGLLWRGWDLFRDYSGHIMTNWGAHSVDMMQYALGRDGSGPVAVMPVPPSSVESMHRDWDHKTPRPAPGQERRFWPVQMAYDDGVEVTFLGPNDPMRVYGERGVLQIRRNHFEVDPPELIADGPDPKAAAVWEGAGHVARPHLENWLECVRSRGVPNAPVEVGHRSVTVCHLANIARELGRPLKWDPRAEKFDDEEANAQLDRPRRAPFSFPA